MAVKEGQHSLPLDSGGRGAESALRTLSIYRSFPLLSAYICSSLKVLNKSNVYENQNIQ